MQDLLDLLEPLIPIEGECSSPKCAEGLGDANAEESKEEN